MAAQSLMTKPSNPILPLSTPVISSLCACILTGLPTPSSVQSTLENDGMTLPTRCRFTAVDVRRQVDLHEVRRSVTVTPWSMV